MAEPDQPKKEMVRVESPFPPVNALLSSQKKSERLIAMPQVVLQNPPIAVVAEKNSMLPYCALLGLSVLILIIEIWTYFS